jgi:hypothetical protein
MTMKNCINGRPTAQMLLRLSLLSMTLAACESDLEFIAPDPDIFVVQAYLFADEPVKDVTVTGVLPIDADSTEVAPVISDAAITLVRDGVRFELAATSGEPGHYSYLGNDLLIGVGDVFQLEAVVDGKMATAETVVPLPPVGLALSEDSLVAPTFGGGGRGGRGGGAALQAGITAKWSNSNRRLHFVVIDNVELNPEILPTTEIFSRFAARIVTQPTAADSSVVRILTLTHFGLHRLKLYRVNDEYADLYEGLEQDSRNLNEPPSNIHGALGVFSAFSADSAFFRVR